MRVFLSWSGERSKAVAEALSDLLPEVLSSTKPWMSETDIAAGSRWGHQLATQLEGAKCGVVCLTPENLGVPWVLFEAGALSKTVADSLLIPYRLGLRAADVPFPLAQFQGVDADEQGTRTLLKSLDQALAEPNGPERLTSMFRRWWPDLKQRLDAIPSQAPTLTVRKEGELLEELLTLTRGLARDLATPATDPLDVADLIGGFCDLVEAATEHGVPPAIYNCLKRMHPRLRSLTVASGPAGRRAGKRLAASAALLETQIEKYIRAGGVIIPRNPRDDGAMS